MLFIDCTLYLQVSVKSSKKNFFYKNYEFVQHGMLFQLK